MALIHYECDFENGLITHVDTLSYLFIVLVVAAFAVLGVAVFALVETAKSMRSVRQLADDLDERLVPMLDKADVTLDAVNAELLRIDGIVSTIEDVSDTVGTATNVVQGAVNAPAGLIVTMASQIRELWRSSSRGGSGPRASHPRTADIDATEES